MANNPSGLISLTGDIARAGARIEAANTIGMAGGSVEPREGPQG